MSTGPRVPVEDFMTEQNEAPQSEVNPPTPAPDAIAEPTVAAEQPPVEAEAEASEVTEVASEEVVEASPEAETTSEPAEATASESAEDSASDSDDASDSDSDDASDSEAKADSEDGDSAQSKNRSKRHRRKADPKPEFKQLVELATQYPEIGPPLAELAFKIGYPDIGRRVVRMGLEEETFGVEYFFVQAQAARRDKRPEDVVQLAVDAIAAYLETADEEITEGEGQRLLHLIRLGFSALMFDVDDIRGLPERTEKLREGLLKCEERLGEDAFYRSLLAQALWFVDAEASEAMWERACGLNDPEMSWNARGTWYREAEHDLERAEAAYRKGLDAADEDSALLFHNLAQVILEQADKIKDDAKQLRKMLREADDYLSSALRAQGPRGLRRHIHATRDRLYDMRSGLPRRSRRRRSKHDAPDGPIPNVGDVLDGHVRNLAPYGAFVRLPSGHVGLLHNSQLAHERIEDPSTIVKTGETVKVKVIEVKGEGKDLRIGLSRKALIDAPEGSGRRRRSSKGGDRSRRRSSKGGDRGRRRSSKGGDRGRRRSKGGGSSRNWTDRESAAQKREKDDKLASLGEILLAKMAEKESE